MLSGFTLLFHGVGSKRRLVQRLGAELARSIESVGWLRTGGGVETSSCEVVDIEGFDPGEFSLLPLLFVRILLTI